MIKKPLFILLFVFVCFIGKAQTKRMCATQEYDRYLKSVSPAYMQARKGIENKNRIEDQFDIENRSTAATVVIPVVVHVVYNTVAQNISDEQVVSQIDALNEDYSATNGNIVQVPSVWAGLVGDANLRFALACKDENGNATNGITRTPTSVTYFADFNAVKYNSSGGHDAWNADHFLNIWVCNLDNGNPNHPIGYAQFPGGGSPETDGVVIHFETFGRVGNLASQYNLGRTATHEVGHWLDLVHIWGDDGGDCNGSDFISDTPNQAKETYGCETYPHVSCNNGPDGDMFMNYMDYTDDRCMMLFTQKQMQHMTNALTTYRDSILTSESYTLPVSQYTTDLKITAINGPATVLCLRDAVPSVTVQNTGTGGITSFTIEYSVDDEQPATYNWTGSLLPGATLEVLMPSRSFPEEIHVFHANAVTVNGGADDFTVDNFKSRAYQYIPGKYNCPVYPETPAISISPNPSNEELVIAGIYKTAQKATLTMCNVLGEKIYEREYLNSSEESITVNVSGLPAGVYLVQIKTLNKTAGAKLVVYH